MIVWCPTSPTMLPLICYTHHDSNRDWKDAVLRHPGMCSSMSSDELLHFVYLVTLVRARSPTWRRLLPDRGPQRCAKQADNRDVEVSVRPRAEQDRDVLKKTCGRTGAQDCQSTITSQRSVISLVTWTPIAVSSAGTIPFSCHEGRLD